MLQSRSFTRIFSVGLMVLGASVVSGQDYPSKPIRIITSGAGGGSDFTSRQIAQGISGPLGQPVIVENRPTALIGELTSKAPPDGYTVLVSGGSLWTFPLLQKVLYDMRDFVPISLLERTVFIMVVHPSLPVKSVSDLIALAKARPGELNYSSGATGGPAHLGGELFKSMAAVNIVNVAYKGSPPAISALIGGEVQLLITDVGLLMPHVKSGRLRGLGVTSAERSALAPGLPTLSESGLPGYELVGATGFFAPVKTPSAIINRLNQEAVRVLRQPEVKERFFSTGVEVVASSAEQLAATIKADTAKWSKVIKDANIRMD